VISSGLLQGKIFLISELLPNLYWADIFDVVIVAFLVYWALTLFRQTKSSFIFFGILIISALYAIARIFNFGLTLIIFRIFFSVIVIGLIVIFQKELRRFFELIVYEFISLWGISWKKFRKEKIRPEYVENIVHVAERLAQRKTGLLIIIRGRESLDYHLQGGFDLNGKISEPLLESIFDPSTPGHDGAVIIEADQITKFAVHLPLSEDFGQIKQYGTRHSAGLGIAEKADSLSIIVSEERGTISIARDNRLKLISEAGQLEKELTDFIDQKFSQKQPVRFLKNNSRDKIVALMIAVLLWYVIVYQVR
jgi:uncharacterized protein (TIGR00159 family)